MEKQLASPIEEVVVAGVQVSGGLELVDCRDELSVFLFYLAEQVVQLAGVLDWQDALHKFPRIGETRGEEIRQRQIVAVVVRGRVDALRLFEQRAGLRNLAGLNVELAQIVIGVVILGFQFERLAKLFAGQPGLSRMEERRRKIFPRGSRSGLDANRLFQLFDGLFILTERGVNLSQQLMRRKALRRVGQ